MRFWVLMIAFGAAFVWCASRVVQSRNQAVEQGYRIAELTREIETLEEDMEKLKIVRASLLKPSRLKARAKTQALKEAKPSDVVVMRNENP